ncbi:MAG: hypothetical protein AAGD33_17870 [Actinomycetota bacterium]
MPLLDPAGPDVVTLTFTGCGTRADLMSPEVGLDIHVADVPAATDDTDGDDLVLVGHCHSGMLLPGVADARAQRLRSGVFVDATT